MHLRKEGITFGVQYSSNSSGAAAAAAAATASADAVSRYSNEEQQRQQQQQQRQHQHRQSSRRCSSSDVSRRICSQQQLQLRHQPPLLLNLYLQYTEPRETLAAAGGCCGRGVRVREDGGCGRRCGNSNFRGTSLIE